MSEIVTLSPIDGREVARLPVSSPAQVDRAVAEAQDAQRGWARLPVADRTACVRRFVDALLAMNQEIVPELAWQMGRPVRFGGEARGVDERAGYMISIAEEALADRPLASPSGMRRMVRRMPAGLVLVIAPWNYPFLTAVNAVVPALLAGNAVILKAAAQTILSGERFAEAARRADLPDGLFVHLPLDHAGTAALIGSGRVDHVNFTGSVDGGRAVERAVAGTFTTLTLELGGKDPAYVREDADVDAAAVALADGAFFNSGQSCCGIERIYVAEPLYARFVERLVEVTQGLTLGDPLDQATTLGPMAQSRFADHVRRQTADAVRAGARPVVDTKRFERDRGSGPYLAPQVLVDVDHSMDVMREESFGPVVGIMKVRDDAEAVALMNDSPYGLTASIWTCDLDAAERLGGEIAVGTVFANRCDYLDPALPWSGCKLTGRGLSLSTLAFDALTRPRAFNLRPA